LGDIRAGYGYRRVRGYSHSKSITLALGEQVEASALKIVIG